jgi:hypothetical protein
MAAPDSALLNSEFMRNFLTVKGRTLVSQIADAMGRRSLKEAA